MVERVLPGIQDAFRRSPVARHETAEGRSDEHGGRQGFNGVSFRRNKRYAVQGSLGRSDVDRAFSFRVRQHFLIYPSKDRGRDQKAISRGRSQAGSLKRESHRDRRRAAGLVVVFQFIQRHVGHITLNPVFEGLFPVLLIVVGITATVACRHLARCQHAAFRGKRSVGIHFQGKIAFLLVHVRRRRRFHDPSGTVQHQGRHALILPGYDAGGRAREGRIQPDALPAFHGHVGDHPFKLDGRRHGRRERHAVPWGDHGGIRPDFRLVQHRAEQHRHVDRLASLSGQDPARVVARASDERHGRIPDVALHVVEYPRHLFVRIVDT